MRTFNPGTMQPCVLASLHIGKHGRISMHLLCI